jgi:hypothetical protein
MYYCIKIHRSSIHQYNNIHRLSAKIQTDGWGDRMKKLIHRLR